MATSPVFSEVIGISFDVDSFAQSIKQLQEMWQEALGEMSGQSPTIGTQGFAGVASSLQEIAESTKEVSTKYVTAVGELFKTLDGAVDSSVDKATSKSAKLKDEIDTLNALAEKMRTTFQTFGGTSEEFAAASENFNSGFSNYLTNGGSPNKLTNEAQQRGGASITEGAVDYDTLDAKQREWYRNYTQTLAQAEDRMKEFSDKMVEDQEAAWQRLGVLQSQAMAEDERRTAAKQSASEQEEASAQRLGVLQSQAMAEDARREAAKQQELEQEEAAERRIAQLQIQAATEDEQREAARLRAIEEQEAAERRMAVLMSQAAAEDARRDAEKLRSLQQEEDAIQRMGRIQAQAIAEDQRRTEQKNKQTPSVQSFGQSFGESFGENFSAESLGNFAGMSVAFGAIGAAIGVAVAAMDKLVELFKNGFEYSEQLEESAAKLQGVIASNVQLSGDFASNFKLAGEAAVELHQRFEDAAIQYGTSVDVLERGFKQLVDGGGVSMVRNLDEAAELAIKFGVALQAAGKDADTSRAIMSELPKLLEGTEKPSSFILETLGLSNQQWDKMIASAKIHHDLLDQISPLMEKYAAVAADAANRQQSLTSAIGLEVNRIFAAGEKEAFSGWTDALKQVKQFLADHQEQIKAIIGIVMDLVSSLGRVLGSLLSIVFNTNGLHEAWQLIGGAILAVVTALTTVLNTTAAVADSIKMLFNTISNPSNWANLGKSLGGVVDYVKARFGEVNTEFESSLKKWDTLLGNTNSSDQGTNAGSLPATSKGPPNTSTGPKGFNDSGVKMIRDEWEYEQQVITQKYQQETDNEKQLFALRQINQQQLAQSQQNIAARQYQDLQDLNQRMLDAAQSLSTGKGAANPTSVQSLMDQVATKSVQQQRQEGQRTSAALIQGIKDVLAEQDKADSESIQSVERTVNARIAALNKEKSAHTENAQSALATERNALNSEKVLVDNYYDNLIRRAGEDTQRVNQLTEQRATFDAAINAQMEANAAQTTNAIIQQYEQRQQGSLRVAQQEEQAEIQKANRNRTNTDNPAAKTTALVATTAAQEKYAQAVANAAKATLDFAVANGAADDTLQKLAEKLQTAQQQLANSQANASQAKSQQFEQSPEVSSLGYLGSSIGDMFKDAAGGESLKDFGGDFADTTQNFADAINTFHNSVNNIVQAFQKGGILGGVGASASMLGSASSSMGSALSGMSGFLGSVGSFAGPFGSIMSAVGGLFSSIASIFTQEAQETAEKIQKAVTDAMNAYSDQQATLTQTLAALQEQRQDAISELSGMKGGQDQLNKLLPQLDQEIAQLQLQIKEAQIQFENSFQDLQLNNTALSSVFDKWQQINTAVQQYLSAGGSVTVANQYISDSLEQIKQQAGDALNQGYQTAISDALNLNQLIQQRMQMEQQEAESEFGIVNGDALERQGTRAITEGSQLQQQKAQYEEQLENLNQQIDLTQQKVALEGQIFDIAMSTAQLQETSNQLQIEQLQEQLTILQGQQEIYNGISQGSNGQYQMSNTLMNQIGVVNIIVQQGGTAGDDSAAAAQDTADAVSNVLYQWQRYGLGTSIAKT